MGFAVDSSTPQAVQADPDAQAAFVAHVRARLAEDDPPALWFMDETAFWADPAPFRRWAPRGSTPTTLRIVRHWHCNIMGAVRPDTGTFHGLVVSHGNAKLFQIFLDDLQSILEPDRRHLMILDNARFHKVKDLDWGNIKPLFLPPYSPNLNVIETLWLRIKRHFFNAWVPTHPDQLDERAWWALKHYSNAPDLSRSTCATTAYFWGLFLISDLHHVEMASLRSLTIDFGFICCCQR